MRLNNVLNNVFRDVGLSSMATKDVDKLAEYSIGNFKNFKKDKPIRAFSTGGRAFSTGGSQHRGTGPTYPKPAPKYGPNYSNKGMPGGSGGGFLDTIADWAGKAYDYADQAHDWATDSWLYRQVETGYNWIRGESGQKIIDNLIDRYAKGKLTGGGAPPTAGQKMGVFSSGAAEAGVNVGSYTAGATTGRTTPLTKALAHAVANPEINPYSAAYIASQGVKVSALNLPDIDTPISMRNKTIMHQPPTTTMTG